VSSKVEVHQAERHSLQGLFDNAPVAVSLVTGPDLVYEFVNPAYQALAPGKEMVGRRLSDVWAEAGDAAIDIVRGVFETGQACRASDAWFTIRRGPQCEPERVCVTYSCTALPGPDGKPERVLIIVTDNTAAVRQLEELQHTVARNRAIVSSVGEGLIVADATGQVLSINPAGLQFFRFKSEAEALRNLRDFREIRAEYSDGTPASPEEWLVSPLLRGDSFKSRQVHLARPDTDESWWGLYNGTAIKGDSGEVQLLVLTFQDITESKQRELALRDSEARLRSFYDSTPNLMGVVEISDDDILHISDNAAARKYLGVRTTMRRWDSEMGVPKECVQLWLKHYREARESGAPVRFEMAYTHRAVSGWLSVAVSQIVGPEDAPVRFSYVAEEITDRKRAEQALRESEERFRSIAESIPQMVWTARPDGAIDYWNARALAGVGVKAEQLMGWSFFDYLHPDDEQRTMSEWRTAIVTGRPYQVEARLRCAKGEFRWSLIKAAPQRDSEGRIVRWFGTVTDIHDTRQAEAELRYQYSITDAIAQNAAEALFLTDTQGRVTFLNRAAEELFGWTREELTGQVLHEFIHSKRPDGAPYPFWECVLGEIYRTGGKLSGHEDVFFRKDGTRLDVSCSIAPVFREGRIMSAVLVVHDISERKRAGERLLQTQKLESIGLLAGGIAHDFNNLLTGILGNASLVLDDVPARSREKVEAIISGAEKAADLTRQLLAYAGKGRFFVQSLNLSDVVRSVTNLLRLSIPKSVALNLDLQAQLPAVVADAGQVQQVVMNLIINGAEAIGEGRAGEVKVSTCVREIDRTFMDDLGQEIPPGRYVRIEVRDTGSGMDEQTRSKIFDPFFSTKFLGRGLGLAAVSGIMRSQKGAVTIRSTPGKGTSFRVLFPAADQPAEREGSAKGTILVVDDEESVREFLAAAMSRAGYSVMTARDGREAMTIWEEHRSQISLILLDVVMPVMGAAEMLAELKSQSPETKVLLTSGYNEEEAKRLSGTYPATRFIQKPYSAQKLLFTVEKMIGK
jgi:PAS domain S-box-containing protein